jgi:hypothetical protein
MQDDNREEEEKEKKGNLRARTLSVNGAQERT